MEGKTVILSVVLLSLVLAQIQAKSCCPSPTARSNYNKCRILGGSKPVCALPTGCKYNVIGNCPPGYPKEILENTGSIKEDYCKLGCASSVCSAITTLQNSDAGEEIVNGAIERCTMACSAFCTKGSITAVETA